MRPYRFGVVFTGSYESGEWRALARRVEDLGLSTLLVADHYINPMACGPLMTMAAEATTSLRVGSYVYNNDFRPPALLAKEVATIDVLSGGRFELGIGAGWAKVEYVLAGQHFDPPKVRADRFEEALGVIRRLLSGEAVDHTGDHYRLRGLPGSPVPVQSPVPLLIGGGGPRMIRLAGSVADIVGFVPRSLPEGGLDPTGFSPSAMDRRVEWLGQGISSSRRADGGPERSVLIFGVNDSVADVEELAALSTDELTSSPHALVGSTATMVDALHERRERWGLTYHVCFDHDLDRLAPVIDSLAR